MDGHERRRFSRRTLPLFCRLPSLPGGRLPVQDISTGGIRIETDEALSVGSQVEVELFLPGGESFSVDMRVAWARGPSGENARHGAGLEFLELDTVRRALLDRCLASREDA